MPRDDSARILDMLVAARDALAFVAAMTRDEFMRDRRTQSAVCLKLEVVGEAARALTQQFRDAYPEVAWNDLIGLRNRIVHEYFRLDLSIIWQITQRDLPGLVRLLEPLVPPPPPEPEP